jgi:hypothetical protein
MSEVVDNIRVAVVHGPGNRLTPVWFDLNRRKHNIRQITNSWRERRGTTELIHFHVTDDGALYELTYNLGSGCWQLELVESL